MDWATIWTMFFGALFAVLTGFLNEILREFINYRKEKINKIKLLEQISFDLENMVMFMNTSHDVIERDGNINNLLDVIKPSFLIEDVRVLYDVKVPSVVGVYQDFQFHLNAINDYVLNDNFDKNAILSLSSDFNKNIKKELKMIKLILRKKESKNAKR
ncbi:MAG: hypothetical protein N4A44_04510 [Alphaproteobacteria bacterium]|jgi:hypothetical protein|nr:hypothetical protein [Alphaproteobacteria bacterium]